MVYNEMCQIWKIDIIQNQHFPNGQCRIKFWCSIKEKHPQLSERAIKILHSFSAIYSSEIKFSFSYTQPEHTTTD